jgi:hypothetical protein
MKRLNINTSCCFTMLTIIATSLLSSGVANARGKDECKIAQMTKWKPPSDDCITKLRTRPYALDYKANEDVECEGWRAVWNTKDHVHELAEGKRATAPTSFAMKRGCGDDGDVVCVMALRQLSPIVLNRGEKDEKTIAAPQPFPTICVRLSNDRSPKVLDACIRGNIDWQIAGRARPTVLNDISPPSPPAGAEGNPLNIETNESKTNCTTCHVKPYIMSTRHFAYTFGKVPIAGANPDADGNWQNTSQAGIDALDAMRKANRAADLQSMRWKADSTNNANWKWAEVHDVPWFGKNTDHFRPTPRSFLAQRCSGQQCHNSGWAISNHANWTQTDDKRDIATMGGKLFMDKNYCEFVVGPAFAHPDKAITFDNDKFRGGMRQLMVDDATKKWPSEKDCRDFWKAIGCEPDAAKQPSLVKLCSKADYPEMFQ